MIGIQRAAPCLLLALAVGSCAGQPSKEASEPEATAPRQLASVAVVVDEDGLWATTDGGERQLLADDGKYYQAQVSPDRRFIVADIAVFRSSPPR